MNGITFLWPAFLWGLLLVPALAAGYLWTLRRRARPSITFPALEIVATANRRARRRRRRLVPAGLFFAAVGVAVLALERPTLPMPRPVNRAAVMLAIDVSGSMLSEDIAPSRL